MNAAQLKATLQKLAKEYGRNNLTPVEIDYLTGKIDFTGYLNRCYVEYINTPMPQNTRANADQGAIYD